MHNALKKKPQTDCIYSVQHLHPRTTHTHLNLLTIYLILHKMIDYYVSMSQC